MSKMRIAVGGFALESVSFLTQVTDIADFERWAVRGPDLIDALRGTESVGGGFIDILEREDAEILPLVYTDGFAAGPASESALEKYKSELTHGLASAANTGKGIDGVLLFLHGAMTTPACTNPDLSVAKAVRQTLGPGVPFIVAVDLHANIDPAMADIVDGLFGFHFSPHTDMAETGRRAARVLVRTTRNEISPAVHIEKPPLALASIYTATAIPPLKDIVETGFAAEIAHPNILDISILCGFAYADVPQIGASVVVVADRDDQAARSVAQELSALIMRNKDRLIHDNLVYSPAAGVSRALEVAAASAKPVVMLEHADRLNDSTWGLHAILAAGNKTAKVAVPFLWDPAAVADAVQAGAGATVTLRVGGHSSERTGGPSTLTGTVVFAGPKSFIGTGPMRAGHHIDLGDAAVIEAGNITLVLTSESKPAIDLDPFIQFGLDVHDFDIVLLRSKTHFRAVYEPIAEEIIIIDTPDWGPAELTTLPYKNVRPGVHPITA